VNVINKDDKTRLKTILGISPKKLTAANLRTVCSVMGVDGWSRKSKYQICELIAKAKKSRGLASAMYPAGELVEQEELQSANKKSTKMTSTRTKLPAKGSKCNAVTTEGTYYRFILAFFAEEMRMHVVQLGDQPTRDQVDNGDTNQMVRWKEIVDYYNDADKEDLKKIPTTDSNLEYLLGVKMVEPNTYSEWSAPLSLMLGGLSKLAVSSVPF
jgi:hypothetical protein